MADYRDPALSTEARVDDLLGRMSLEEKVAQLMAVPAIPAGGDRGDDDALLDETGDIDIETARDALSNGAGHLTRVGGGGGLDPARAAEVTGRLQNICVEESDHDIPALPHEECLSGYMGPGGTTYPQAIGLASTWEPNLIEGMTDRIRQQMQSIGTYHALSPVLDIGRDPRWGRTEETYGEDPLLVAAMACAYVEGLQGADFGDGISATAKHFAAHGVGEAGKNHSSVHLGERELREVHLFPFEAAVREAGVESIMNAYHDIDGVPCAKDESLLTGILRGEWGFDGTVVADYFSVRFLMAEHGVAESEMDAAVQALEAGLDVELPQKDTFTTLVEAVEEGILAEATLDESVRRVLGQKFRKGLFEEYATDPADTEAVFGLDAFREYARKLGRESVTLLKNDDLLPLNDPDSVALLGPKADSPTGQLGDYAYAAHYPEKESTRHVVTPREALTERLGEDAVAHVEGCTTTGPSTDDIEQAAETAAGADVAVVCVGARSAIAANTDAAADAESTSGEGGDVADLGLPGVQQELVAAVQETDTPLVVVFVSGKPHSTTWIDEHVPAVVHAWLPGEEGGHGIADVLLGEHNPSGRLPISVPKNVGQLPVYYARRPNSDREAHVYTDSDPLYPFGHGLSYTDFEYADLELTADEVGVAGTVEATIEVENAGDRAGHEVVQLYSHEVSPSLARPVQELVGFQRVHLEPGDTVDVTFEIDTAQLASHDQDMNLVVEPGRFELRAGKSAADIESTRTFEIVGDRWEVPRTARTYFSQSRVEE